MSIKLSKTQQEIVDYNDGALLVMAGPGSGKTRVVIERIKRLLQTGPRVKVLALTFSNMAAEEMRDRIKEDSNIDDLIDNATIGTIHAFCLDMVQNRGYLIGLDSNLSLFESAEDRKKILLSAIEQNYTLSEVLKRHAQERSYLSDCLTMISDYKKKFISPSDPTINENNALMYKLYNEQLLTQGGVDFDDILFYAYRILSENPNIVKLYTTQYKYICVDEAQDLNFAQYMVIKALCGESFKNIMMVGDENQSIYGFNGSDSTLMSVEFKDDFNPHIFRLDENFRSAKKIVQFANTLEQSSGIPNCFYEGELTASSYFNETKEAEFIRSSIEYLMKNGHPDIEGPLKYDDFAIIARNKYVFSAIEEELSHHGIPYYYKKTTSGIESESDYFKAFDLELRLIANPKDILHSRELESIVAGATDDFFTTIHDIVLKINKEPFELKSALKKLETLIPDLEISDDDKYMALNDCSMWKEHWQKYSSQVTSEQRTIVSFRNHVSLGKTQLTDNNNGVSLLSAHMSKGLQFEVVYIIGLSQGTFPDYRAVNAGGKEMDQEKNNMYVAVTRAKRLCFLSYAEYKKMPWGDLKYQQPSQFITSILPKNS